MMSMEARDHPSVHPTRSKKAVVGGYLKAPEIEQVYGSRKKNTGGANPRVFHWFIRT